MTERDLHIGVRPKMTEEIPREKEYLQQVEDKLYNYNRQLSLKIAFTKDIILQHKLMKINTIIGEAIKECRK